MISLVAFASGEAADRNNHIHDRQYTDNLILDTDADVFFQRLSDPEDGYHRFAAMQALQKKAKLGDQETRDSIIRAATRIVRSDSEPVDRRWQSCYVLSGIGDRRAVPVLRKALLGEHPEVLRSVATCALGTFLDEKDARKALAAAQRRETSDRVLASIDKVLGMRSGVVARPPRPANRMEKALPRLTFPTTEASLEKLPWPHQSPDLSPEEVEQLRRDVWVINDFPLYQSDRAGNRRYFHGGLDVVLDNGTKIYAMKDGWVKSVRASTVTIADARDDSPCYAWQYTHLSNFQVSVGNFVKKGTWIGNIDFQGLAHIHLSKAFSEGPYWGECAYYCIPNGHFEYTDKDPPVIQTPFWFFRNNTDEIIAAPAGTRPILKGAVDIVVGIRDAGSFAHSKKIGFGDRLSVAQIQYEISQVAQEGGNSLRSPSFDFRNLKIKRGFAAANYGTELTKVVFKHHALFETESPSGDKRFCYYVITNCPQDGAPRELEIAHRDHCWDTLQKNDAGEPLFPNGLYRVTVTATDFAGNSSKESVTVEIANPE